MSEVPLLYIGGAALVATRNLREHLDPCQFSYRKNKSTEDSTLLYNNLVVEHLENKNAYVRSVFIDFSSAFNTLKPDIVINKLRTLNVSPILCQFILDFLTNREQSVRINDNIVYSNINQYRCTSRLCTLCYTVYYIHKRITITFQELSSDQIC